MTVWTVPESGVADEHATNRAGVRSALSSSMALAGTRSSHRWAEPPGNFDSLNCRAIFPSSNQWGIPDKVIRQMVREGKAHVAPQDYQSTLTANDRASAIIVGGRPNHLIQVRP